MRSKLTILILVAAVAGVLAGYAANEMAPDAATAATIAGYFSVLADIFLRLIKMIIAPLVFATVVAGIAGTGDAKTVGRIGAEGARVVHHRIPRFAAPRDDVREPLPARAPT